MPEDVNLSKFDRDLFNINRLRAKEVTDAQSVPVIIKWANDTADTRPLRQHSDIRLHRTLETINATAASVSRTNSSNAYRTLASAPSVEFVHYDALVNATGTARENIDLSAARAHFNVTGAGVEVAVLDSGVNESHPDIGDDEIAEINLVHNGAAGDAFNHGTAVAGLVTGDGTASNGTYEGVAPDADIIDVQVLDRTGSARTSTIIDGVDHAIQQDVDLITMSLGQTATTVRTDDPLHEIIDVAVERNITVVAAAGNTGSLGYGTVQSPGILRDVITVGASDDESGIAPYSNRGPTPVGEYVKPDLVAPGGNVTAPNASNDGYHTFEGTSYATPLVSGTAALLKSRHPDWSPQRIKNVITSTADSVGTANTYLQGSGELNVSAALGANLIVDPATIDFGSVPAGETTTRTIRIRNLGSKSQQADLSTTVSAINSSTSGQVSLNRSSVMVPAGGSVAVELSVDASDPLLRPYSGRLQVGDATAIFGYVPKRQVTVTKRWLGSTTSDRVTLIHPKSNTVYGPKTLDGSEVTFEVQQSGKFIAFSSGRYDGQPIVTANSTSVEGTGQIILDERQTVRRTIDTGSLPQDGSKLINRTVIVNATLNTAPVDTRIATDNPKTAAIWISPTPTLTYAVRRVMTIAPTEQAYNTSTIYHLKHVTQNVSSPEAVKVDVDVMNEQIVHYYRGVPGETYNATLAADAFDDVPLYESYTTDGIGTTFEQTIYSSPDIAQYHDSFAVGSFGSIKWTATPQLLIRNFEDKERIETAVKKHPFRSKVSAWSLSEQGLRTTLFPTVGQPPNGYVISDLVPDEYDLWVNGERIRSTTRNEAVTTIHTDRDTIRTVRLRVRSRHGMSSLSNDTVTTFTATTNGSDTQPPTVPSITFEEHGKTNIVSNGSFDIEVSSSDASGIQNLTLYVATRDADGVPATTPFENASDWRRVSLTERGDGTAAATLDLGTYRGTLSVATRAVDDDGNTVETTATDAVVVGSRTPTARLRANTTLTDIDTPVRFDASDSYDDLAVATYHWDFDGDSEIDETTDRPTAIHRYEEPGAVRPTLTVVDSHGFTNTTRMDQIAIGNSLHTGFDNFDNRTRTDVRSAIITDSVRLTVERLNGRQQIGDDEMLVARSDVNGGITGGGNSTIVVNGGQVNGRTDTHNLVAADSQFNGGVVTTGTVTVVGSTTAKGGIEAAESIRVLSGGTLTVQGALTVKNLTVASDGAVTVHGSVDVDRFRVDNATTIRIQGSLDCESVDGTIENLSVRGSTDCEGLSDTNNEESS
ncbi:peptidase S8 and S53 subtilisin kexin sedolisin [Halorientalis sp. IM1011]|uniref:S8 family serine peptidase n=1 Tax=Halorientalis sp. IM1011 TaxID=1932360 RepID=UPI00097CCBD0|nr:S8 family serine peptidase [Halorientalis sp. IM1011]AQL41632.1 peptidase S8 and S53 subtilisin kexin sedolisin [Halorientalis sp. IM1011]